MDVVGRVWDQVLLKNAAPIVQTLGMHTNDKMISFCARDVMPVSHVRSKRLRPFGGSISFRSSTS